jgi:hypothetical protein
MEIRPRMLSKTPLGKFMAAEVKRRKSWNKAEYWRSRSHSSRIDPSCLKRVVDVGEESSRIHR